MPISDYHPKVLHQVQNLADEARSLWGIARFDCVRDSPPRLIGPQYVTVAESLVFYLQAKGKSDTIKIAQARRIIRYIGGLPLSQLNDYAIERYAQSRKNRSASEASILEDIEAIRAAANFCGRRARVKIV